MKFERAPRAATPTAPTLLSTLFAEIVISVMALMTPMEVARHRLHNQRIAGTTFAKPSDVVRWLGAVQAQNYLGSLWAIGLRMQNASEQTIEQAIADRTIIRTWPMRGTLHFVAAADVRWMLQLLTPRVLANNRWRLKQLDLNDAVLARSKKLFVSALSSGKQLSRDRMYKVLEAAGISTASGRGLHILAQLAQEGIICFGRRQGKQQTFALLDEWAPAAKPKSRDEALAELARRYFTSHGPAMFEDFVWWSGLTTADARAGCEMAKHHLGQELIRGRTYWVPSSMPTPRDSRTTGYLLPPYDEYTVAYKDRSAVLNSSYAQGADSVRGILGPVIVIDRQIVGTWKRTWEKGSLVITAHPFSPLKKTEKQAFAVAARQYGEFLRLPVALA